MEKARDQKAIRTGVILLIIAIITFALMSGTVAKYVTSGNFDDQARVAKWGLNVEGTADTLFDASYLGEEPYDSSVTVEAASHDPKDHVIAPGTSGYAKAMIVQVDGQAPEVMYDFDCDIKITDGDSTQDQSSSIIAKLDQHPAWWWIVYDPDGDPQQFKTHAELEQWVHKIFSTRNVEPNNLPSWMHQGTNLIQLAWQWNFDNGGGQNDALDTELGNLADQGKLDNLQVNLRVNATQSLQESIDRCEVSFDTGGGSKNPDAVIVNKGSKISSPKTPTKPQYICIGWELRDSAGQQIKKWDFDSDTVESNMILHAIWQGDVDPSFEPGIPAFGIDLKKTKTATFTASANYGTGDISVLSFDEDVVKVTVSQKNESSVVYELEGIADGITPIQFTRPSSGIYAPIEIYRDVRVHEYAIDFEPPTALDLTYTGEDQSLARPVVVKDPSDEGAIVSYALSDSSTEVPANWDAEMPAATDASTYYVWYKIDVDDEHGEYVPEKPRCIETKIKKAASYITVEPTGIGDQSWKAEGYDLLSNMGACTGGQLLYAVSDTRPEKQPASQWSTANPHRSELGTYNVWYYVDGGKNYEGTAVSSTPITVTIEEAAIVITKTPSSLGPLNFKVVDHEAIAQALCDEGVAEGATCWYGIGTSSTPPSTDQDWSTDIPEQINHGTYYVWYQFVADEHHTGTTDPAKVAVDGIVINSINRNVTTTEQPSDAKLIIEGDGSSTTFVKNTWDYYNAAADDWAYTSEEEGIATVENDTEIGKAIITPIAGGSTKVTFKITDDLGNYNAYEASWTINVDDFIYSKAKALTQTESGNFFTDIIDAFVPNENAAIVGYKPFKQIPSTSTLTLASDTFTVTAVGDGTTKLFNSGKNAKAVSCPSNIVKFNDGCFAGDTNLTSIDIKADKENVVLHKAAFEGCGIKYSSTDFGFSVDNKFLLKVPVNACVEVPRLANGVGNIPAEFFKGDTTLKKFVTNNPTLYVGTHAFQNCSNLENYVVMADMSKTGDESTYGENVFDNAGRKNYSSAGASLVLAGGNNLKAYNQKGNGTFYNVLRFNSSTAPTGISTKGFENYTYFYMVGDSQWGEGSAGGRFVCDGCSGGGQAHFVLDLGGATLSKGGSSTSTTANNLISISGNSNTQPELRIDNTKEINDETHTRGQIKGKINGAKSSSTNTTGGIYVYSGTCQFVNGCITSGTGLRGGAISVGNSEDSSYISSVCNMYGGYITGCKCTGTDCHGGAVAVHRTDGIYTPSFTMYGGIIKGNFKGTGAAGSGGVWQGTGGTITKQGGTCDNWGE